MSNNRPQVPDSAMTGTALESVQKPACDPDSIMDTEQDVYSRKRGYRNIDELLDNSRRM